MAVHPLQHRSQTHAMATARRAFSMIEVLAVLTIMSVLALTAVPALSRAGEASALALRDCLETELSQARARAMAEGRPYGLTIDSWQLARVYLPTSASTPTPAIGPMGQALPAIVFEDYRPGTVLSVVTGSGSSTMPMTVWFSHDGTPELRDAQGDLIGPATSDIQLRVGLWTRPEVHATVYVRRLSGVIESQ